MCLSLYKSSENKFYIYVKNQEKFRKMSVESDGQNLTRLSGNQYKIYMECMENDREKADWEVATNLNLEVTILQLDQS